MTIVSSAPVVDATPAQLSPKLSSSHITLMHRPFGAPRIHMDEEATGGSSGADSVMVSPEGTGTDLSISQAARALQAARYPKKPAPAAQAVEPEPTAESAEEATAEDELAQANAEPAEEQPIGEEPEGNEPEAEKLPPIERPRSWSKDADDDWNALPRARQEKIAAADRAREAEIRQRINEAAEKLKAVTAKEQVAEQVRTQYEGKLKSVVDVLEREQLRDFPDIRSMADIEKMAADATRLSAEAAQLWATDPFAAGPLQAQAQMLQSKLQAFGVHQQKLAAAHNELQQTEQRQAQTKRSEWDNFVKAQNELAVEHIPELADKDKAAALTARVGERMRTLGFNQDELDGFVSGEKISPFDHRFQRLLVNDLKLSDIQNAKVKAAPKPVPPVQRPGIAQPRSVGDSERTQALDKTLSSSGKFNDALALLTARRNAQRRAS